MSDSSKNKLQKNAPNSTAADKNLFVVGIGASAGGLSALEELFNNLSTATGAAFVVIQHLSPDFKSLMKELLERHTSMSVYRVTEGMILQPNSVYLIPPGQNMTLEGNILRLKDRKKSKNKKHELNFPIDLFFTSLAKNYGENSIGIILSGSGSDGTRGLKAVNEAGGLAFVQEPKTAEFDGMPVSAISTGVVNQVLPPRELSQLIYQCLAAPANSTETESRNKNQISSFSLSEIAKLLLEKEGLDFSRYKSNTVSRRIHRRCLICNCQSIDDYIKLLEISDAERKILSSDLLINVTHFFRDRQAWNYLESTILPQLIERAKAKDELRFWVTACSTGEEAYSLAILVYEALQNSNKSIKAKIFATDIDRNALEKASQGIYPSSIAIDISSYRLHKYFVAKDNSYQVMRKIREMLIFSLHDLTKDSGFTRIDIVTCRNVLIYMKSDLQYQVLRNLHFSLNLKGILFLGEAETLGEFESEFDTLDKKWKFYQKQRDIRLPIPLKSTPRMNINSTLRFSQQKNFPRLEPLLEQCLNRLSYESDSTILLVSKDNCLLHVSGDSSRIFKTPNGKITTEVTKMVAPPLQLPLNTALHRVRQKNTSVLYTDIRLEHQDRLFNVSLEVIPSPQVETDLDTQWNFTKSKLHHKDITSSKYGDFFVVRITQQKAIARKIPEAENFELGSVASRRIMELESELQHTRENLQSLVEELETTNEEQQASNEELTASNEELQSTNEELHSVNEELHTVNIEYQSKIGELIQLNDDVDNLLKSTEIGVIFLDADLRIRKFTSAVTSAIALRKSDLERPLEELYWKFDCPNLFDLLREVLETKQPKELEVKLKQEEKYLLMQINIYQTESRETEGLVVSFVRIDEVKQAQQALKAKEQSFQAIFNSMFQFIGVLDLKGTLLEANQTALDFGGLTPEDILNRPFWEAKWWTISSATQEQLKKAIARAAKGEFVRYEVDVLGAENQITTIDFSLKPVTDENGKVVQLIPEGREISELKQAREELKQSNLELEKRVAIRTESLAKFSDRLKQLHRLATSNYQHLDNLFSDYLQAGCQMFNLSTGIISEVNDCIYKIMAVESPFGFTVGDKTPCVETYCVEVVETQTTIAIAEVGQIESMQNHPLYLNFKFESFLGTPIFVNEDLYGTLNFSDTAIRESGFAREEIEIVELMAKDIGNSIASSKAQAALKESEARFRNTFEQAAVGVAHVSPDGKFIRVNQRCCEILGYTYQALLDITFQDITYPEDLDCDLHYLNRMLSGEINKYSIEKRYIKSDRSIVWANLTVSLVKDDSGQPDYFISVLEDISDRK